MSMISRIGAVGCLLLSGCSLTPSVSHGPVTEETLRRLDERAISKDQLFAGLATGAIRTDLSGHHENVVIPLHLVNGTPRIDVGINGGAAQMLLDSGAARTMIEASVAVKNKVTLLRAEDATVSMRGVIGNEEGRLGVLSPLKIGPWELHGYPCIVRTHQNTVRTGLGSTKVESSLLGFDIPSRFCTYLTIDYRTSKAVYGFHKRFVEPKGPRVAKAPYILRHDLPFVTVKALGKSWEALIDTGSFNGIEISQEQAEKLGVAGQGSVVEGLLLVSVGGTVTSAEAGLRTIKLPEIRVFGGTYKQAQVDISPGISRIGSAFFKDYRVTFDFRRRMVWLEW